MKRVAKTPLALIIAALLPGCAYVTVTKLSPNSDNAAIKGQRISLPRPYIKVTPKDDGDIEAAIIYLPDPEHTYAIDSSSYFATDQLDVTTANGVVTSIKWTGDSSGVVADAIKSSGNVAGEILKAEEAKKAAQKTKEEEASKAVDDAQLEFDQAQNRLSMLRAAATLDQVAIQQAEIALEAARIKLQAAKDKLARVRGILESPKEDEANQEVVDARQDLLEALTGLSEALAVPRPLSNDVKRAEEAVMKAAARFTQAQNKRKQFVHGQPQGEMFGPMLFAIHEEIRESAPHKTLFPFLEIVTVQQNTDPKTGNWKPSQPKYPVRWPEAPMPPEVRIFPEGTNTLPNQDSWRLTLQSSVPLVRLVEKEMHFRKEGDPTDSPLPPITFTPPTFITVNLEGIPPGGYILDLAYRTREHKSSDKKDNSTKVKILIHRKSP